MGTVVLEAGNQKMLMSDLSVPLHPELSPVHWMYSEKSTVFYIYIEEKKFDKKVFR